MSSPPVHGPLDNVLRGPASIVLLGTVPGLPASREELDGGVAPDLQGGVVKVKRVLKGRERAQAYSMIISTRIHMYIHPPNTPYT